MRRESRQSPPQRGQACVGDVLDQGAQDCKADQSQGNRVDEACKPKFDSKAAKRLISLRRVSPLCDYGTAFRQVLAGSGC